MEVKTRKKKCAGVVWQYQNSPERGLTWAAEASLLMNNGQQFTAYGQKTMKAAIAAANKGVEALGWELVDPWVHLPGQPNRGAGRK